MKLDEIDYDGNFDVKKLRIKRKCDLYNILKEVKDYRHDRGKQYVFADLLFVIVAASLCGFTDAKLIVEWCKANFDFLQTVTMLTQIPSSVTIARVFRFTDADKLHNALEKWVKKHFPNRIVVNDHGHIHVKVDGKATRAAALKSYGEKPRYSLDMQINGLSVSCYIKAIDSKHNECGTMPDYIQNIELPTDLQRYAIATTDAAGFTFPVLHTIVDDKKWDFLIPIKGNQPNLFNAAKEHVIKLELSRDSEGVSEFDKLPKCTLTPKKCHGRQEVSVCTVLSGENLKFLDQLSDLKDNLVRPYIKSIAVVDKTTTQMKNGQLSTSPPNRSYYATSVENIDPKYVLQLRSSHWGLEMQHYLLDTALREDLSTKRKNYAMENGNIIRRFALTVYANRPDELVNLSARHYFDFNKMNKNEVYKILMVA